MNGARRHTWPIVLGGGFALFVAVSLLIGFEPGRAMGREFLSFLFQMLKILPCVFILIGLFDVWIKTETVERYLGHGSGFAAYLLAILLAASTVGGLHVGLPVAHALHAKRARLGVVLAFLSAAGICRIPMSIFEASFLGWKFTAVRFAVSLPLVVISSAMLGRWFENRAYVLPDPAAGRRHLE